MVQIDLSPDEAVTLRAVIDEKLQDLLKEINRTDSLSYKADLKKTERVLERLMQLLPAAGSTVA